MGASVPYLNQRFLSVRLRFVGCGLETTFLDEVKQTFVADHKALSKMSMTSLYNRATTAIYDGRWNDYDMCRQKLTKLGALWELDALTIVYNEEQARLAEVERLRKAE